MGTKKDHQMSHQRLALLLACLLLPCVAGTGAAGDQGTLKGVDLLVNPTTFTGSGPAHFFWTGEIRVTPHNVPMTVQYQWHRSDKAMSGITAIVLNPGVESYQVQYDWQLGPFSGLQIRGRVSVQLSARVIAGGSGGRDSSPVNAQYDFAPPQRR
jgi:hypothetical protein